MFDDVDLGASETQVHTARTRATQLTKAALQGYIQRFFDKDGDLRYQVEELAPYVVQYVTGVTGASKRDDATVYEMQIARMWPQLRQTLPAFLIIDQSFQQNSTGFGGVVDAYDFGGVQGLSLRVDATIGVTVEVLAHDQTAATDLRDVLALVLGPLTLANKSYLITPDNPTASWEVRLPMKVEAQGVERRQIQGDQLDTFWVASVNLNVDFEGVAVLAFEHPRTVFEDGGAEDVTYDPSMDPSDIPGPNLADIFVPDVVYFGYPAAIPEQPFPFRSYFMSDNPRVLRVEGSLLVPKRYGSCQVLLYNERNEVLRSFPVTVESA